jgi:hypothetical protein
MISGGNGNDILYDGNDNDTVFGSTGDDRFFCRDSSRGWMDQQPGEVIEKDPIPPIIAVEGSGVSITANNLRLRLLPS